MTSPLRRIGARLVLAFAAGAVLVLGPSAALAQTPSAPAVHQHNVMCPSMDVPWV